MKTNDKIIQDAFEDIAGKHEFNVDNGVLGTMQRRAQGAKRGRVKDISDSPLNSGLVQIPEPYLTEYYKDWKEKLKGLK